MTFHYLSSDLQFPLSIIPYSMKILNHRSNHRKSDSVGVSWYLATEQKYVLKPTPIIMFVRVGSI